jgi:hypothetical protein
MGLALLPRFAFQGSTRDRWGLRATTPRPFCQRACPIVRRPPSQGRHKCRCSAASKDARTIRGFNLLDRVSASGAVACYPRFVAATIQMDPRPTMEPSGFCHLA